MSDPGWRARSGAACEAVAASWLESRGWRVAARNWRSAPHEIDIVVRRGRTVAFVEVRFRRASALAPAEALPRRKLLSMVASARAWIAAHGRSGEAYRLDVIAVTPAGPGRLRLCHYPSAWRP
jgi:putative endonuclease